MRTAIFMGLMTIAFAIDSNVVDEESQGFVVTIAIVMMVMDVVDFLNKTFKTK